MVVTPGAAQRQSQHGTPQRVDLLIDDVHLHFDRVILREHLRAQRQKPRGHRAFEQIFHAPGRGQQVSRQLLMQKLVKRFVGIQRLNDVVAIAEGVGVGEVFIESIRVGIAHHVEPVPAEPLTISR